MNHQYPLVVVAFSLLCACSSGTNNAARGSGGAGGSAGTGVGGAAGNSSVDGGAGASNSGGTAGTSGAGGSGAKDGGASQPSFPITAAFYYGWYPETWTVNGAHVFYHPTLGYYSTTDPATQKSHIEALDYAGMKAAISSWWGQGHYTDTRLGQLMQRTIAMGSPLKWAIYYENEGTKDPTSSQIASDLGYVQSHLATSPAYLRVGGKFVVFVYNANDTTCAVATRWKQANDSIGDAAYVDLKVFPGYRNCADQPDSWHQYGPDSPSDEQKSYSFTIAPGFWRADETSARLARDPARWKQNVADMAAASDPWKLVTTFNEWGEGTACESANEWKSSSGYGTYLDALHAAFGTP